MMILSLILAFSAGKKTDAILTHGVAAGVGYVVGRNSAQTAPVQVVQSANIAYSTTNNAGRCRDNEGGCGYPSGKGWDAPISHRAFLIMRCGAPRSVVITKRTWGSDNWIYIEWLPQ